MAETVIELFIYCFYVMKHNHVHLSVMLLYLCGDLYANLVLKKRKKRKCTCLERFFF